MTLNGTVYYYERDNQCDITGLVDSSGNEVVTYTYDSWGKLLSTGGTLADTVGVQNPFRYRSYYYDNETGLYYLQSRYYNPELSRFISADDPKSHQDYSNLISANLYSYANDNPVLYADPDGKATSTPYPGYYIEYDPHTYDSNVKLVQKQLDNVFGYSLDADGYFGPVTKSAVMDFQNKHSQCGGADGIVGPNTWAVLFASNNTPTTPVSSSVSQPVANPTVPPTNPTLPTISPVNPDLANFLKLLNKAKGYYGLTLASSVSKTYYINFNTKITTTSAIKYNWNFDAVQHLTIDNLTDSEYSMDLFEVNGFSALCSGKGPGILYEAKITPYIDGEVSWALGNLLNTSFTLSFILHYTGYQQSIENVIKFTSDYISTVTEANILNECVNIQYSNDTNPSEISSWLKSIGVSAGVVTAIVIIIGLFRDVGYAFQRA